MAVRCSRGCLQPGEVTGLGWQHAKAVETLLWLYILGIYFIYLFIYLELLSCTYLLRGLAELESVCFGEPLLIFFFFLKFILFCCCYRSGSQGQ